MAVTNRGGSHKLDDYRNPGQKLIRITPGEVYHVVA